MSTGVVGARRTWRNLGGILFTLNSFFSTQINIDGFLSLDEMQVNESGGA